MSKKDKGPTIGGDAVIAGTAGLAAGAAIVGGSAYGYETGAQAEKHMSEANRRVSTERVDKLLDGAHQGKLAHTIDCIVSKFNGGKISKAEADREIQEALKHNPSVAGKINGLISQASQGKVVDPANHDQVKAVLNDHPETAHKVGELIGIDFAAHGAFDTAAVVIAAIAGATLYKRHQQREDARRANADVAKDTTPGRK